MKRKRNRRYTKTLLSLLLALLLALQGTEPIFVQAKETIVRGKVILQPQGKEFFTCRGKNFFTSCGKEFFT